MNRTLLKAFQDISIEHCKTKKEIFQLESCSKPYNSKNQTNTPTTICSCWSHSTNDRYFLLINIFGSHLCYKYSMLKSQYDSTDIYSDQSSTGSEILLRLSGLKGDWHQLLLNGEGSDFRIIHRNITYSAHRAVIFKHMNLHVLDDETTEGCLHAPDSLNPHLLTGVLSCLYGLELKICRSQALETLNVVHFLKVAKLKRILEEDILGNFEEYELFPVLERARYMGMHDLEQACMRQLEVEGFEQMRYCKFQLLGSHEDVFRFVIHSHNERHWEDLAFGQSDKFIQDLIQQYCTHNGYNQRKKTLLLKSLSELSSKNSFPSLGNIRPPSTAKEGSNISINVVTPRAFHTDSMIAPANCFWGLREEGTRSMIMDLTFMGNQRRKKANRASEHNSSHSRMASDVIAVKETYIKNAKEIEQLKDNAQKIELILTQKEGQVSNNKFRLSQIERLLEECEKQIMENNRNSRLLQVKFDRFEQKRLKRHQSNSSDLEIEVSSDEDCKEGRQNPKDHKLRVSLIESRWVCC